MTNHVKKLIYAKKTMVDAVMIVTQVMDRYEARFDKNDVGMDKETRVDQNNVKMT